MNNEVEKHLSVSDWLIIFVLQIIPIVNIICLFKWALSKSTPASKKTWAKAYLIVTLISVVIYIIYIAIFAASLSTLMQY